MKRFTGQGFLVVYSGLLTAVVTVLFTSGFSATDAAQQRFDTLTVQRINIVEPDGTLRMVLSNNRRIPNIIVHGREYPDFNGRKASTAAGILFYDAQATESGGLTFGGLKDANGNISRFGHLSFDRYDQDQMLSIDATDDGTNHASSIRMIDQPNWPIQELLDLLERIQTLPPDQQQAEIARFLETHPLGAGVRTILTNDQRPDTPGATKTALEFLNESGQVTHRYPPSQP
jgi:hypothetical protein